MDINRRGFFSLFAAAPLALSKKEQKLPVGNGWVMQTTPTAVSIEISPDYWDGESAHFRLMDGREMWEERCEDLGLQVAKSMRRSLKYRKGLA